MLGHYLLVALRSFQRNPLSTAIKLLALSLGLVSLLTAHMIGDYFRNADTNWANSGRIYAVIQTNFIDGREFPSIVPGAATAAADYLRADFPELEAVARLGTGRATMARAGDRSARWTMAAADADLLRIFDLKMAAGGGEDALAAPRNALIARRVADSLFGDGDPIGRTIDIGGGVDLTVTGVLDELPEDSHLVAGIYRMEILTSFETMRAHARAMGDLAPDDPEQENWRSPVTATYVLLPEDGSLTAASLNRRLRDFGARHVSDAQLTSLFVARPVSRIREMVFDRLQLGNSLGVSFITVLYLFGALTLAVACVDFAGLAVAEAARRTREIGLRRTLGARRSQVAVQMLVETGMLCLAALLLVLPLCALLLKVVQTYAYMTIPLPGLGRPDYWLGVLAIACGVTLVSAAYPVLILARIRPAFALRALGLRGGGAVRSLLVGLQFAAAGFLIALISVMLLQTASLRAEAVRRDADLLVDLRLNGDQLPSLETLRTELLASPAIVAVAVGNSSPYSRQSGGGMSLTRSPDPAAAAVVPVNYRAYSYDYLATIDAAFLAGRDFSRGLDTPPASDTSTRSIVIDSETARLLGFASPGAAIGQLVYPATRTPGAERPAGFSVIGVIERPPFQIFADGPHNFVYGLAPDEYARAPIVRISKDRVPEGIAHIDRTWERLFPGQEQDRYFMDVAFKASFYMFSMLNAAFVALAGIAAAIAAMGLFGMASFVVQRRLREIGVRKTLGASGARVLGLMLWDFSRPVIVANVIAWPFAYIAARAYLELFVTRIALTPLPFLGALGVSLLIAWIAVGAHAVRAASVKPALVLKTE